MSYNNKTHTANWVSWQLNRSWIGAADRKNDFRPDDALPTAWYKVRPNDYTGSGYDRGHIAPSADRTRNDADNSNTFLMSNMVPQSPELNRGVWRFGRVLPGVGAEWQGTLHRCRAAGESGKYWQKGKDCGA